MKYQGLPFKGWAFFRCMADSIEILYRTLSVGRCNKKSDRNSPSAVSLFQFENHKSGAGEKQSSFHGSRMFGGTAALATSMIDAAKSSIPAIHGIR